MTYYLVDPRIGAQVIGATSATARHPLGTIVKATDSTLGEGQFIYVQVSQSLTQYDAVFVKATSNKVGQLTIDAAKTAGIVGFAQIAFGTKDEYGWIQITGRPLVRLAADCEPSLALYATTTGGVVDDATTSAMIQGLIATNSVTNAVTACTCTANFPTVARAVVLGAV